MSFLRPDFKLEPASCYVDARCPRYKAVIPAEKDLSPLIPYLNAEARVVFYDPDEPVIIFRFEGKKVAVRSGDVRISDLSDIEEGRRVKEKLEKFLEELWKRREEIKPRYEPRQLPPALEIYKLLPGTNCGKCGEPSCLALATRLSTGEADPRACLPLYEEAIFQENRLILEKKLTGA
ncbi:(Fe-S)-binding protein [Thermosulfurimonas dismutans]|uniref:4Fe-4S domain-containing protein n=1 Tax=Thermosulfurimonas dismutans TaxID=999894 RepID=A0A179D5D9_9BACT|nr:(Fe-S)-binding protein [Thermosulfurimonas dismutans]OAQ20818.1 hypothetical protein TDIS_1107 [Thermosulfurimonas dismutans]